MPPGEMGPPPLLHGRHILLCSAWHVDERKDPLDLGITSSRSVSGDQTKKKAGAPQLRDGTYKLAMDEKSGDFPGEGIMLAIPCSRRIATGQASSRTERQVCRGSQEIG